MDYWMSQLTDFLSLNYEPHSAVHDIFTQIILIICPLIPRGKSSNRLELEHDTMSTAHVNALEWPTFPSLCPPLFRWCVVEMKSILIKVLNLTQ